MASNSFNVRKKLDVLDYLSSHTHSKTFDEFKISDCTREAFKRKCRRWKKKRKALEEILESQNLNSRKRIRVLGGGRKAKHEIAEQETGDWVRKLRSDSHRVTTKQATAMFQSKIKDVDPEFKCSERWETKFKKRQNLTLRSKTGKMGNRIKKE